jgi:predicted dehydrogenase
VDFHRVRRGGEVRKSWTEVKNIKAYEPPGKDGHIGQSWWSTYRYQLEEFVNRIKGRPGSGVWVNGADSIAQMEIIDRTYERAGLRPRDTSKFKI